MTKQEDHRWSSYASVSMTVNQGKSLKETLFEHQAEKEWKHKKLRWKHKPMSTVNVEKKQKKCNPSLVQNTLTGVGNPFVSIRQSSRAEKEVPGFQLLKEAKTKYWITKLMSQTPLENKETKSCPNTTSLKTPLRPQEQAPAFCCCLCSLKFCSERS